MEHDWMFFDEVIPAEFKDVLILTKYGAVVVGWRHSGGTCYESWGGSPILNAVAWQKLPAIPEQYRKGEV